MNFPCTFQCRICVFTQKLPIILLKYYIDGTLILSFTLYFIPVKITFYVQAVAQKIFHFTQINKGRTKFTPSVPPITWGKTSLARVVMFRNNNSSSRALWTPPPPSDARENAGGRPSLPCRATPRHSTLTMSFRGPFA